MWWQHLKKTEHWNWALHGLLISAMPPIFKSWISEQPRRAIRMGPSILNRAVVASWTWYVRTESTSGEIILPKRQQVIAHHSNSRSNEKAISKPISSSNSPLPGKSFQVWVSAISLRMNPINKAYDGFSGIVFVIKCVYFSKFSSDEVRDNLFLLAPQVL